MAFMLKVYQQRCLDELARYLREARERRDADTAFYNQTRRAYAPVKALPEMPYVCVRVPTGGGKTVLAAHAIGLTSREYLSLDRCLVLWLAPTTQIVEQTLAALRDKRHPYRQALDDAFAGCVSVMDLGGALALQRSTLETDTVVIVATMAAMRVENTEGRKIYEQNGQLMPNFTGLDDGQLAELGKPMKDFDGQARSLANLLRIRRPVVIVDEAHNARTGLSFDTLARFNPACILEFTATPDQDPKGSPSNVLTQVSAAELKAENMIKLPIRLKNKPQWKEAIAEALNKQAELERLSNDEEKAGGGYVRPIVLFQAQRKADSPETVTFEVLKRVLLEDFKIPEEQIAIATGGKNELENVPILARDNPVRFIITVDKLREGWDCPYAYILCSVSNLSSKTAVEQILGRILRLPYAKRKGIEELNQAYAFVTSQNFTEAANALTEALVESGFDKFEAKTLVRAEQGDFVYSPLFAPEEPVSTVVEAAPVLTALPAELRERVSVRTTGAGKASPGATRVEVVYTGPPMTTLEAKALVKAATTEGDRVAMERLVRKSRREDASPAAMGEAFSVPALAVRVDGTAELFEDQFREAAWKLSEYEAVPTESEFSLPSDTSRVANVDVQADGKIAAKFFDELERQLTFLDVRGPKTPVELAAWLDGQISHPDITAAEAGRFLHRMVTGLTDKRGIPLERLVGLRYRLRDVAEAKIAAHRRAAEEKAFRQMLLPGAPEPLVVEPKVCFTFPLREYPATKLYDGKYRFNKHYYEVPAEMNGQEADCALLIDSLPQVKFWVRNLVRDQYAFWLPTTSDKFYPDFVALLTDGRFLVVEFKGADRMTNDDSKEKKVLGELWAARSGGRCVFRFVGHDDMESEIRAAVK